jgi:hypothetical protein
MVAYYRRCSYEYKMQPERHAAAAMRMTVGHPCCWHTLRINRWPEHLFSAFWRGVSDFHSEGRKKVGPPKQESRLNNPDNAECCCTSGGRINVISKFVLGLQSGSARQLRSSGGGGDQRKPIFTLLERAIRVYPRGKSEDSEVPGIPHYVAIPDSRTARTNQLRVQ